jgi:membrane-associated phospholipid phosphatase
LYESIKEAFPFPSSGSLGIFSATLFILVLLTPFDYRLTLWLAENNIPALSQWLDQSFFEGGPFGGSDVGILIYLGALIILLLTNLRLACVQALRKFQRYAIYLIMTGVATGSMVHGLKTLTGRLRPSEVLGNDQLGFTPWFQLGPQLWTHDQFSGSLPSGHTATLLAFLAIAYLLCYSRHGLYRQIGFVVGLLGFTLSGLMGVSRSMLLQHWVTDWVFTIGFGWGLIHYLLVDLGVVPTTGRLEPPLGYDEAVAIPPQNKLFYFNGTFAIGILMLLALRILHHRSQLSVLLLGSSLLGLSFLILNLKRTKSGVPQPRK